MKSLLGWQNISRDRQLRYQAFRAYSVRRLRKTGWDNPGYNTPEFDDVLIGIISVSCPYLVLPMVKSQHEIHSSQWSSITAIFTQFRTIVVLWMNRVSRSLRNPRRPNSCSDALCEPQRDLEHFCCATCCMRVGVPPALPRGRPDHVSGSFLGQPFNKKPEPPPILFSG